jgi:glycosyltransferase involved in cell wall biosynthesis
VPEVRASEDSINATERPLFTVFTPTFNRADRLHRPFESLLLQDRSISFEWLVIDDGSTDETPKVIDEFRERAWFPIRYFWKENEGKHRTLNRGYQEARGVYFAGLDSDDEYVPETLIDMKRSWETIPESDRSEYGNLMGLVADQNGNLQGKEFPEEYFDSSILDCRYKLKIHGERLACSRTEVLRQFPMPEPDKKMPWFSEGVNWARIGRVYKTRFVNHVWRRYFVDEEDSIMHIDDRKQWHGYLSLIYTLNEQLDYFWYAPRAFFRHAIGVIRYGLALDESYRQMMERLHGFGQRLLVTAAFPAYRRIERKNNRMKEGNR